MEALNMLIEKMKKTERPYNFEMIEKAYRYARSAHEGQQRQSGEPYFIHPVAVATILVELGMDTESIVAALLHDVVEDTECKLSDIEEMFGPEVATLVDGVTKLGRVPYCSREEQQAENVRKMLLAMSEDIRVIIIKLADRLHNMRTLQYLPEQKRRDKARETMDIYAPIAHRLGIRAVKEELEDLSIRYLDPVAVQEIEENLNMRKADREDLLNAIKEKIMARLKELNYTNVYIEGRVKSVNGIYRKMIIQGKAFEEIYDIYAVRIIVDTLTECYNILGVIHDIFHPIPGRFKDYISTPKPNMYQSLHTTVIGKRGVPFEVQIRTWEMHHTAEYGIAAHWKYKLGLKGQDKRDNRLSWIRQMLENQKDVEDVEDIVRSIKSDLAPEEVFAFTPKGDVISMPIGATVIDFAYTIHTAVGNRMVGAKVDGRIVPIDHKVKTGEIVEVLTTSSPGHGPSRDWLKIVQTGQARNKIRQWFKKERREENIIEGRTELEREFNRNGIHLPDDKMKEFLEDLAKRQHCNNIEELYAAIGYGGVMLSRIMPRIREEYQKIIKSEDIPDVHELLSISQAKSPRNNGGVIVEGLENCLVKFSRCCNPLPGDDIVGFITRGYGVSIHKRDCTNVPENFSDAEEPERWVNAHWDSHSKGEYKCDINVVGNNRRGMLADLTSQLAVMHIMIHAINAQENKQGQVVVSVTIGVNGQEHVSSILNRLSKIKGVVSAQRA
ncbi:RelA/SpoT family protein [Solibaculum mannosilyticum]|uniref:GTP diphosphokinase n=1 Tax=Solibaculum mannosilyticum TaxID=2780922 RepID=A0A7I8D2G9_9FIRM|nr:bifunctional (p)ppGpp synthetase/guanosine-3',5'-bis(diphosphate) 3'-pyrophosphohydrolase [Solibaculum mannosilyticum]BCI60185.1 GTP pyrophosphokinase [Solibaculum mannosilyticum]